VSGVKVKVAMIRQRFSGGWRGRPVQETGNARVQKDCKTSKTPRRDQKHEGGKVGQAVNRERS